MIRTNLHVIVVECKFGSDFYEEQLEREINAGLSLCRRANKPSLILLTVSDHLNEPDVIEQFRKKNQRTSVEIKWVSWQRIRTCLREISNQTSDDFAVKRMLKDVIVLMEKKGLRGFRQFRSDELETVREAIEAQHFFLLKRRSLSGLVTG